MNTEAILKGIASYAVQQEEILAAIREHGGNLHQKDFDKTFGDRYEEQLPNGDRIVRFNKPRIRIWNITPASFVLGYLFGFGDWSKYLDLTHLMAGAGLVTISGEPPNVVYSLPEPKV